MSLVNLATLLQLTGQQELSAAQLDAFAAYLDLLLRWNEKVNLTSIRDEESILRRHFLECIACARLLPSGMESLLDYGSGGGFPGIPCAICRPEFKVTLAESQGKKAAFLQEAVRTIGITASVFRGRVEDMAPSTFYDIVTLRAVDKMQEACAGALQRVRPGGWLAILATRTSLGALVEGLSPVAWRSPQPLPGTEEEVLLLGRRLRS